MRPIDADALSDKLGYMWRIPRDWDGSIKRECEDAFTAIDDAPTIDAESAKWIDASKRTPETDDDVLCWYEYYRYGDYNRMYQTYGIGCYCCGVWCGEVTNGTRAKVLYWMSLPKPPRMIGGVADG